VLDANNSAIDLPWTDSAPNRRMRMETSETSPESNPQRDPLRARLVL
jgi:hypothetical protein